MTSRQSTGGRFSGGKGIGEGGPVHHTLPSAQCRSSRPSLSERWSAKSLLPYFLRREKGRPPGAARGTCRNTARARGCQCRREDTPKIPVDPCSPGDTDTAAAGFLDERHHGVESGFGGRREIQIIGDVHDQGGNAEVRAVADPFRDISDKTATPCAVVGPNVVGVEIRDVDVLDAKPFVSHKSNQIGLAVFGKGQSIPPPSMRESNPALRTLSSRSSRGFRYPYQENIPACARRPRCIHRLPFAEWRRFRRTTARRYASAPQERSRTRVRLSGNTPRTVFSCRAASLSRATKRAAVRQSKCPGNILLHPWGEHSRISPTP